MTRSRLRRPTSKSITTTVLPAWASAAPREADAVVFPPPPLPDVTTMTLDMRHSTPTETILSRAVIGLNESRKREGPLVAADLHSAAMEVGAPMLGHAVESVDGHQFGLHPATEDARLPAGHDAGDRPTPQRAVDVD